MITALIAKVHEIDQSKKKAFGIADIVSGKTEVFIMPKKKEKSLHLVEATAEQKDVQNYKARPSWAQPIIDQYGNTRGWQAKPNLLAKTVLEENNMLSAVDQSGKSTNYLYNGDYWEPIDLTGIRNLVASYFYDDEHQHAYDLLSSKVVNDTSNLVTALMTRERYEDTFDKEDSSNLDYVPFNYYDYNIITNQIEEHSPERYFTYNRDYDIPDTKNGQPIGDAPLTNNWLLESLGGDEKQLALMKIFIGASFYRSYKPLQFMIFITGEGGDGKSEFLDYWGSKLIGSKTNSHLSFDQIVKTGTNFALAELYHKELNTYDDLNASYIDSSMMGTAKQLTGGNPFDAEVKNKGNLRFANYAKMVFATNDMPEIQNLGFAEKRRIYIFKWNRIENFEKKFPMMEIIKERGEFVKQCIDTFSIVLLERRLGKTQQEVLPKSEAIEENWRQFQLDSDPVARFVASRCEADPEYKGDHGWIVGKRELYENFIDWADGHNLKVKGMTDRKFNKKMKKLGYQQAVRRIDGTNTKVWMNIMLLSDNAENDIDSNIGLKKLDY